jgi:hypothetical protein
MPGLWLDTHEHQREIKHGAIRVRTSDSWPVLWASVLLIVSGLSMTAWNAGDVYTFGLMTDTEDPSTRAVAFIINGIWIHGLTMFLSRKATIIRTRLAQFLRLIIPSHILAALLTFQIEDTGGLWLFWLILLSASSISFCFLSAWKQWRSFLLSGMVYFAITYARTFSEVSDRVEPESILNIWRIGLAAAMLLLGLLTMILAWRMPVWLLNYKQQRWFANRRHIEAN